MKLNYKKIGDHIRLVDERNTGLKVKSLLGLSISKQFIPSVANIIGTDMENYKIIRKNQFACSTMQVRRDKKMPVALLQEVDEAIISAAYPVFEIKDNKELLPEYLMMWFSRVEFDREACFYAIGGVRGSLEWEDFCDMKLPIPKPDKQKKIVKEYNTIVNRITLNNQLIQKLEETAQAIYKQWFVDFEFPDEEGKPYKSNGGKLDWNEELGKEIPKGWEVKSLKSLCSKIGSGATPKGGKESYHKTGVSLVRSMNVHDYIFSTEDLAFINDKQAKALETVSLVKHDILLNITGVSVARCCMVPEFVLPGRVNQHVMIIRPREEYHLSHYLLCLLCYSDSKSKLLGISQSGSTREAITKMEIEEFKVIKPEKLTLKSFDQKLKVLLRTIEVEIQNNIRLNELQNLLLSKLATLEN
ncbi:MAG TPA: restriction endonuclease subunit S [Hanamia sp.]|nr:restriction endonuclease subunit S [Hanamia sp.]